MANIGKDYKKLREVSKCFTEETLKNILHNIHNGNDINVIGWDFAEANAKGDNYLSIVYKIKVIGNIDGKKVEIKIVVKSLPNNIGRRNTYRSTDFFRNEIAFYTKVIPKFEQFIRNKVQTQILRIPHYLSSIMDGENDYVALEDVTVLGYKPIARQNCLNLEQSMMILEAMANLHAVSFAYKDQHKAEYMEIVDSLHETYFSTIHWNWYKQFHQKLVSVAKNAVTMEYPGSDAEKKLNTYEANDLYQKASELCNRKHQPTSVISHGDCWIPNFMARCTTKSEAMILDFQLARCASPILDLSTFLYACTDKAVWDKSFDELLQFYYNNLCNTIALLGSNPAKLYPRNLFQQEVKEQFIFGLIFAMEIIPMSLLGESDIFDLDVIKDDKAVDIADVWSLSNIKTQAGRCRLANVIIHAVQKGFL